MSEDEGIALEILMFAIAVIVVLLCVFGYLNFQGLISLV